MDQAEETAPTAGEHTEAAETYLKPVRAPEASNDPSRSTTAYKDSVQKPSEAPADTAASKSHGDPHKYRHKHHRETAAEIAVSVVRDKKHHRPRRPRIEIDPGVLEMFQQLDTNKSETLTIDELLTGFSSILASKFGAQSKHYSVKTITDVFNHLDPDTSGCLSVQVTEAYWQC